MEVSFLNLSQYNEWNKFVDLSMQGSAFGKTGYLDACQASYRILACRKGDELVGGIILSKSKWGKYTNPLLCKYLGLFLYPFEGSTYQVTTNARKVQNALIEGMGRKRLFNYMFHPNYKDWLPLYWAGFKQSTKYTYRIPLSADQNPEDGFYSRLRGKINKIRKEKSYTIRRDITKDEVFGLLDKTFRHQKNKNPFTAKWLDHYIEQLTASATLSVTGIEDDHSRLTCVLGVLQDANTHYLLLNGVDHDLVQAGQNEILIDEAILRARADKAKHFDFEGSMIKSVESFYRQFGGELTPYFEISR